MRQIDADALSEQIEDCKYFHSSFQEMTVAEFLTIVHDLIDNAPTVETKTIKECIIAYGDGYESAKRLYKRPQGEWICDYRYLDCKCSICNSYPLERGDYPELSPYCPQCGARMEVRINGSNNNT